MKKIKLLLLLPLFLLSCVDNSSTFPDNADGVFYGRLTVGSYTQDNVGISVTVVSDSTVDVFFDNVKFAALMPVKVDINVKGIPSMKSGEVLTFSAVEIDPYMNKEPEPQPEYRFATFRGVVKGNELVLEAKMSDDLKSSSRAGKEFRFNGTCNWINGKTP